MEEFLEIVGRLVLRCGEVIQLLGIIGEIIEEELRRDTDGFKAGKEPEITTEAGLSVSPLEKLG